MPRRILPAALLIIALAAACAARPASTPSPTNTPTTTAPTSTATLIPTATPAPTATPIPTAYPSGGLGQDTTWWTARHGEGKPAVIGKQYGLYEVLFLDGAAGHIERLHTVPMPFIGAQREARTLLPVDAAYINIEYPADRPGTWIEHYHSPTLAARFGADVWINAAPGDFLILYKLEDDQAATRVVIALGNNP